VASTLYIGGINSFYGSHIAKDSEK